MSQILFALFALAFVQLVKSQTTACLDAVNDFSDQCIDLVNTLDPTVCSGTCGTQWIVIYNACLTSVSLVLYIRIVVYVYNIYIIRYVST